MVLLQPSPRFSFIDTIAARICVIATAVGVPCLVNVCRAADTSSKLTPDEAARGATVAIFEANSGNDVFPRSMVLKKISLTLSLSSTVFPHAFNTVVTPSAATSISTNPAAAALSAIESKCSASSASYDAEIMVLNAVASDTLDCELVRLKSSMAFVYSSKFSVTSLEMVLALRMAVSSFMECPTTSFPALTAAFSEM